MKVYRYFDAKYKPLTPLTKYDLSIFIVTMKTKVTILSNLKESSQKARR